MLARYFFGGAQVWKLSRVPIYRQEEARVILQAQYEARAKINKDRAKAGALTTEIILPEF